jgi:hypothetical protein
MVGSASRTDALLALLRQTVEGYRSEIDADGNLRRLTIDVKFREPTAWPHLPELTVVRGPRAG